MGQHGGAATYAHPLLPPPAAATCAHPLLPPPAVAAFAGQLRATLEALLVVGAPLQPTYWLASLAEVVFSSGGKAGAWQDAAGAGAGEARWGRVRMGCTGSVCADMFICVCAIVCICACMCALKS